MALGAKCFLEPFSHGVECTREIRDFVPAGPHGRQDALREITCGDMLSGTPQLVKWKGQVAAEQQASQRAYQCRNTDGKRMTLGRCKIRSNVMLWKSGIMR